MTEPPADGGCCRCILSFTITSALAAVFIWLSFRPSKPTLSIQQFYLFALNTTTTTKTNNHTIFYDLKLNNNNDDKGVFYDPLNLTFYYNHGNSSVFTPFGSGNFTGFYQGHGKHAERAGVVVLRGGQGGGGGVFETVSKNGVEVVVFRVEVATAVRYKIVFWKTKRKRFVVGGEFKVDDHGVLVKRKKHKGIKLSNCGGVGVIIKGLFKVLISLIISLFVVLHLV